ncbi:sensor histidine kinase [Terrisporobacter sp.]|uniref:sensor histidine kinase n=1 Tax=Terrisporobacter sp. TaxID=1965305 RepID=UPI002604F9AD|nr:HAMP domain-containing sensor histidine kinase [Terrisporobacter sp.]
MFKKLRTRFILINMTLLSIVFITIFGTIYFITNNSINRDIEMTIDSLMNNRGPKQKPNLGNIVVEVDEKGNIINYLAHLNSEVSTDELQNYVNTALKSNSDSSKIKINDESFMYTKKSFDNYYKIVFLNITYEENLKLRLLQIFTITGGLSLVILLFISIYLTDKSIQPIKDTFEKQKQFIADASHELKTPLTIIKTNTSLILSNPEDTIKNQSKWIKYIESQSDRMSNLVNEMLSLAKLDIEENKLILSSIDISKIIENMLISFDAIIFENNISLEENITKNIFINGNEESIRKLFSILMDNAIKYTNLKGKISVDLYLDRAKAILEIKNTGEGIDREHLDKIFERFYRIDNSRARDTGGYGLGLSIAKSIVDQHKGKIYAKSKLNNYTTFIVEVPYLSQ